MSSAICFNLDQYKILSSGNELKDERIFFVVKQCVCFSDSITLLFNFIYFEDKYAFALTDRYQFEKMIIFYFSF